MSIAAMAWAWRQDLPPTPKLVLLALADHADDQGVCWPGQRGIAAKVGRSRRTVQRTIMALEGLGLLAVEGQYRDGARAASRYKLPLGGVARPGAPPSDTSVVGAAHSRVVGVARPDVATGTIIEPSVNHQERATPEWFKPLASLQGYKPGDHVRAAEAIRAVCVAHRVEPAAVVNAFAGYWPQGQTKHGWTDPVQSLVNTADVEARKLTSRNGGGKSFHDKRKELEKGASRGRPVRSI